MLKRKKPTRRRHKESHDFRKLTALIKKELVQLTNHVTNKTKIIMATLAEVKAQFESLKTAIAEERAQATAKLAELQTSIDQLTANIAGGGTAEERDVLLADIQTQVNEVKAIIPDAPPAP